MLKINRCNGCHGNAYSQTIITIDLRLFFSRFYLQLPKRRSDTGNVYYFFPLLLNFQNVKWQIGTDGSSIWMAGRHRRYRQSAYPIELDLEFSRNWGRGVLNTVRGFISAAAAEDDKTRSLRPPIDCGRRRGGPSLCLHHLLHLNTKSMAFLGESRTRESIAEATGG